MTALLIILSLVTFVAGQLILKVATTKFDEHHSGDPQRKQVLWIFGASIFSMAISFFVNIGLLQKLDLSYLFPFQGISIILVAFCSAFFLKERVSVELVAGVLLVTVGAVLVGAS
jgi:drug/metabolite transporter (DMT)-like permease